MNNRTQYDRRVPVAELRRWLAQFADGESVFIGGTPVGGYIVVDRRIFALYDDYTDDFEGAEYAE